MNALRTAQPEVASRSSRWGTPGFARRVEQALFTVTLAAMGYLCLGPLFAAIWV
jgi:hypothetical protein